MSMRATNPSVLPPPYTFCRALELTGRLVELVEPATTMEEPSGTATLLTCSWAPGLPPDPPTYVASERVAPSALNRARNPSWPPPFWGCIASTVGRSLEYVEPPKYT